MYMDGDSSGPGVMVGAQSLDPGWQGIMCAAQRLRSRLSISPSAGYRPSSAPTQRVWLGSSRHLCFTHSAARVINTGRIAAQRTLLTMYGDMGVKLVREFPLVFARQHTGVNDRCRSNMRNGHRTLPISHPTRRSSCEP